MVRNNLLDDELKYSGENALETHLHLCTYNSAGVQINDASNWEEVLPLLDDDHISWLQVHGLKDTSLVESACNYYGIDFLVAQDIMNVRHLTKIEQHDDYNVFIIKLLVPTENGTFIPHQLSVIQGYKYVLTFVDRETNFFDNVWTALKNNVLKVRERSSDFLLSILLNSVMGNYMTVLSSLEDELEDLEESLLDNLGGSVTEIGDIQLYRRQYRLLKKTITPLKEQMNILRRPGNPLIKEDNIPFFNDVNDHLQFVLQSLDSCRDTITGLVDLYLSNNDLRMNNIMKQLTVVSTLFIPLTFFTGVWGMNFKRMPELEWDYGYAVAWTILFTVTVLVFFYFKRKKWY